MAPPVGPKWRLPVIALLLIASIVVGGYELRRPAAPDPDALIAQSGVTAVLDSQRVEAKVVVARADSATSEARTTWRQVSAEAVVAPVTPADTQRAVAQVPVLKATGDSLERRSAADSVAHAEYVTQADAEIASMKKEVVGWRDLARHPPRPRIGGTLDGLWDPITDGYAASSTVGVRVVGDWHAIARVDRRFEPHGTHTYLGVQLRF